MTFPKDRQRLRVGILANEFFDNDIGPLGGFGWAASRVATLFLERHALGIDPIFLRGNAYDAQASETSAHGTRALSGAHGRFRHWRRLRAERIGLLLSIDFRLSYRRTLFLLPRTPVILWSRDPRDDDDWRSLATLRIPGSATRPQGVAPIDCSSLGGILAWSRRMRRRVVFATPSAPLREKIAEAYEIERPEVEVLPNPLEMPQLPIRKSPTPVVLFLGRLDPYKRPWTFVELARRFPDAEFVMLGQAHFSGAGAWTLPADAPPNLRALGHVDGEGKRRELSRAWILVNTSIHEGLPVSFQEALAHEIPIVSGRNPEGVTERFGVDVGQWNGDGLEGLDAFTNALAHLLSDHALRQRLGREGREWVESTHGIDRFLDVFLGLARRLVPAYRREKESAT